MEDEHFVSPDSNFVSVFDGHGGAAVSKYLKTNIWEKLCTVLGPNIATMLEAVNCDDNAERTDVSTVATDALSAGFQRAFQELDDEVLSTASLSRQGSTAVAVCLLDDRLLAINIGDSRAVLSRDGQALDLTRDHKPHCPIEQARVTALGGAVVWSGWVDSSGAPVPDMGCYRVNGVLAVARAVGDKDQKPYVSGEAEVTAFARTPADQFVVLASDGLWDVMESQEAVEFVHSAMADAIPAGEGGLAVSVIEDGGGGGPGADVLQTALHNKKRRMAQSLVEEAMRRRSSDNVTVIVAWL